MPAPVQPPACRPATFPLLEAPDSFIAGVLRAMSPGDRVRAAAACFS